MTGPRTGSFWLKCCVAPAINDIDSHGTSPPRRTNRRRDKNRSLEVSFVERMTGSGTVHPSTRSCQRRETNLPKFGLN
jgi:hypothetical protein